MTPQSIPLVAIGATFQKHPTVLISHPGVARIEDLKGKPIAIGAASNTTFWPWLKQRYGFSDDQKRPYGFPCNRSSPTGRCLNKASPRPSRSRSSRPASCRSCSCWPTSATRRIPRP